MTIVFTGGNPRSTGDSIILSHDISHVQNVQDELKAAGRDLKVLPDFIRKNSQLKILDLSNNLLGHAEDNILSQLSGLKSLTRLNLSANELKILPLNINYFPLLEALCVSGNELEYLSEGVTGLYRLRRLHCDFNLLKYLPVDWSSLVSLNTLSLSNNRLEEIPATIWTLQCLHVLNLNRNRISNIGPIPDGATTRLKELRLAWNRLSGNLDLSPLLNLAVIDVSHNDLEDLEITKLEKLETIIVSHNSLKCLSLNGAKLRCLQADANDLEKVSCKQSPVYLEFLNLSHNNLSVTPEWVSEAKSLESFNADHNQIALVPKHLFANCNLKSLHLNHNLLDSLPELLTPCHVRSLCLQYNKIEQLPENFFLALPCLETLNLSYNLLQCLPPSYGTNTGLKNILLSGNQLTDLSNLSNLIGGSRLETLYLAYNGVKEFPEDFFATLLCLKTLSLSGNGMENVSSHIAKVRSLQKLYLHSNHISLVPLMNDSTELQVLDLACNNLQHLELASIVPKDLTYLDLSSNCDLQIDPTDFQHLCCQRPVAVVDVNCAGRQAPISESNTKENDNDSPWLLGFTESQDGNTRLYIEFQKDKVTGRQEALIALMEVDSPSEVGELRKVLPELLKTERECKETHHHFLKNALLSSVRFLRSRGYYEDFGITMCHLSSSAGNPVTLRLGTIGRPSSCVLGRAGNVIVLAQRQDTMLFGMEDWNSAMEATEVCCNNNLGSSPNKTTPKGLWSSIPEPEVRELVLSPQDKFLVFGDNAFSRTVPADEVCRQIQSTSSPVAAGKSLSEMYSALTNGRRECIAVIMLKSDASPQEEEVEKYRCWEFMLEQNHKLLFTKELETIHKSGMHNGEQRPVNGDSSWYTTAFSKYKCPLPSHRGRYYCYGNKTE